MSAITSQDRVFVGTTVEIHIPLGLACVLAGGQPIAASIPTPLVLEDGSPAGCRTGGWNLDP